MKTYVLAVALAVAGCGDDQPGGGDQDGGPQGGDLTVEIHRSFPFVDGDTVDQAVFVAVQDGDGGFVAATGNNGVYHVHVASERYGIAVGCSDTGFVSIEIVQQTLADGTTYRTVCKNAPATANLDVTVTNLPANHQLQLRTPINSASVSSDGPVSIAVAPGTTELFGKLRDEATVNFERLFRIPSIAVQTSTAITIDATADGAPPETGTFTLTPAGPVANVSTSIIRPYGAVSLQSFTAASPNEYLILPAALRQPDDLFSVSVIGSSGSDTRIVKSAHPLAFTLPAQLVATPAELVTTPVLHPTWTFTPSPTALPVQSYFLEMFNFFDLNATTSRVWFATLSSAWVADAPTVRYEFPDLSGMPGFSQLAFVDRERLDTVVERDESTSVDATDGRETASSSVQSTVGEFCGDGVVQALAGEACDPGSDGESATCNSDCTPAVCGDGKVNFTAGEDCDPPDGTTCSATCTSL